MRSSSKKHRKKPSEKLIERLREKGLEISPKAELVRTYAGYRLKAAGTLTWFISDPVGPHTNRIGSFHTVTELLKADDLDIHHHEGSIIIAPEGAWF